MTGSDSIVQGNILQINENSNKYLFTIFSFNAYPATSYDKHVVIHPNNIGTDFKYQVIDNAEPIRVSCSTTTIDYISGPSELRIYAVHGFVKFLK